MVRRLHLVLSRIRETDDKYRVQIDSSSDFSISIDMIGHNGYGKTKAEAFINFRKEIIELAGEVDLVKRRVLEGNYIINDY